MVFIILQIDSLKYTQDKNKNEKDDSQKGTSRKVWTDSECEKQVLAPPEPELLAKSKEEVSKIEREDGRMPQPGDGKTCSHFQCPSNNHVLRHIIQLVDL